jgi:hypothetical protein
MGSAGQIDARAAGEGGNRCFDRCADGAPRALHHFQRPGEADASYCRRLECPGDNVMEIAGIVHAQQLRIARRARNAQRHAVQLVRDACAQPRILRHREPMSLRQRQHEVVGVIHSHPHHCR